MVVNMNAEGIQQTHRLLARQVKRHLGDAEALPASWRAMLVAVNEAYVQFESDYALLERSLELSSQELRAADSEMRAMYERLIHSSVDGICAFDRECSVTVWNPAMERFTGVKKLQVIGKRAFDGVPALLEMGYQRYFQAILSGESVQLEEQAYPAAGGGGEQGFCECRFAPLLSEAGAIIGGLGILRDVTQRRRAEDALHRQHEQLSAMQEMALRLTSMPELHELLEDIIHQACLLMETPHAFLALREPGAEDMVCQFASGTFRRAIGRRFGQGEGTLIAEAWETHEPVIREHYQGPAELQYDPLERWIGVPLLKGSDIIGMIGVAYGDERHCPGGGEVLPIEPADAERSHESGVAGSHFKVALLKQFAQLASIGLVHGALNEANARLEALATTDPLTGLPNRMLLLERVGEAIRSLQPAEREAVGTSLHADEREAVDAEHRFCMSSKDSRASLQAALQDTPARAEQAGDGSPQEKPGGALLALDLDRFKEINDTFGHQIGDQLLQEVGTRLRQAVCQEATIARLGGDEFAVFVPRADETEAGQVAAAISRALEEPFVVEGYQLQVEVSIGCALYPVHGTDPLTLFRRADVAMYSAKRGHKGYAAYDACSDQYSPRRLALLGELRKAIASGELRLYYQPKGELRTGVVKSVEALVRWQHPTLGFIPPDQFIPLAEQTGLIEPLTRWVVETAIRQCKCWLVGGRKLSVAVNLSMWNLRNASLPDTIGDLLARYEVPPSLLCVEVTESAVMTDTEHTLGVLNRLFALGVRIAIDDYGTGYASLSYLKRLPADELKIDRAFVQHVTDDRADQAIVRSTVTMVHSMGIRVVAEGVEDEAGWQLLKTLGCDVAQGYYLSRPVPAQDLERWLREREGEARLLLDERKEAVAL